MGSIGSADDNDLSHAGSMLFRKGERHHAAIGGAENGMQPRETQFIRHAQQHIGLIIGADRRKATVGLGR
jgi:hypothetical protein